MTATTSTSRAETRLSEPADSTPDAGRRRGGVLLLGALVLVLIVTPIGPLPIFYVPLVTGMAFLIAAAVSGKTSALWGAGVVVTAWGIGIVLQSSFTFDYEYALGLGLLGLGVLAAATLGDHGWGVGRGSLGWPIVFIATGVFLHGLVHDNLTYVLCGLTAVWGLWELVSAQRKLRTAEPAAARH